ncbi:hypothetical protein G7007_18705 [Pseudomonas entomophila]|uniref:hypothetical protein n=1 Tax=Pseudomonas entomophila TaxID=312306 RepID=UPI0015E32A96|nr:hypothetical protein [Pseudomonas entomophila]MBA1194859.1 hypothetical protein [Pseudomonas entomophila]
MSKADYITVRGLSLREAAEPANRARVEAYLKQECCALAWHGYLRMIGEAA